MHKRYSPAMDTAIAMDFQRKLVEAHHIFNARGGSVSPRSESKPMHVPEALDLSAPARNAMEDLRKTPSPSHGSIFSDGSPSISMTSSPGKCPSEMQIGRFNLAGLLPRNLLTPTINADDRMSPRSLAGHLHIKREVGESNPLVNLKMEQSMAIPPVLLNPMGQSGALAKAARPFKAYPHDPLSLAASFTATDGLLDSQSADKYNEFRKRMIEQIYAANGGQPTVSNPKMRRTNGCLDKQKEPLAFEQPLDVLTSSADSTNSTPTKHIATTMPSPPMEAADALEQPGKAGQSVRDSAYYERRRKNNAAAKKSRDRRRIKEDEIAIRAAFLERENIELKFELATARKQLALYGIGRV